MSKHRNPNFMSRISFVVIAAVAAGETIDLSLGPPLIRTILLLIAFTVLHILSRRTDRAAGYILALAGEAVCAIAVMAVGSSPSYGIALFFVICAFIARRLPRWVSISVAAFAILVGTVTLMARGQGFQVWFPSFTGWTLSLAALIGFLEMYRRSRQEQAESEQLLAELTDAQDRVREMAILKERDRLAREMHDAVGHRLTVVSVLLESAARFIPTEPERALQIVDTSRTQIREGLEELRAAVRSLVTPDQQYQTVAQMLGAIVKVYSQASEAQVSLEVQTGLPEPDTEHKHVIVRTAQEGLTNAQKHSRATRVRITLIVEGNEYLLSCSDNGCGIAAGGAANTPRRHFGIANLRARAAAIGGSIELIPQPEGGALLRLALPVGGGAANG